MRTADKVVQRRVATTLAHFCTPDDQRLIFIENNGEDFVELCFRTCFFFSFAKCLGCAA
jgi:hypothetical protein